MDADPNAYENNKRQIFHFIFSSNISYFLSSLEKSQYKTLVDNFRQFTSVFGDQHLFKCKQRRINPTITQQGNFCSVIVLYFNWSSMFVYNVWVQAFSCRWRHFSMKLALFCLSLIFLG